MRFVTIFPELENVHLTKDVGMIPYILGKYYGYDSKIVCYKNSREYSYLYKEVNGLEIEFIDKEKDDTKDVLKYILRNAKNIDVLNLYHITSNRNYRWILLYKLLNPKGKVFLKLDADFRIKEYPFNKKQLKWLIKKYIIKKLCYLKTIESTELYNFVSENWDMEVKLVPNGFYDLEKNDENTKKINKIITVGRIGTEQKATQILLNAFLKIHNEIPSYNLEIIGPIEEKFKGFINRYYLNNPEIKDKVSFSGAINDKVELEKKYKESKIFCLTSLYEGFPLVYLEALKNGCFIVTSNVESSYDVIFAGETGVSFEIGNVDDCADKLLNSAIQLEGTSKENKIKTKGYENFNWINLCEKINLILIK